MNYTSFSSSKNVRFVAFIWLRSLQPPCLFDGGDRPCRYLGAPSPSLKLRGEEERSLCDDFLTKLGEPRAWHLCFFCVGFGVLGAQNYDLVTQLCHELAVRRIVGMLDAELAEELLRQGETGPELLACLPHLHLPPVAVT